LEVRFEVMHVYFTQHYFFIPLPHVSHGIQNAAATTKKKEEEKKDPGLHKGNTDSQTPD